MKIGSLLLKLSKNISDLLFSETRGVSWDKLFHLLMKKRLEDMQTLCAGCSKVEPKFSPAADPLPGGAGWSKFS